MSATATTATASEKQQQPFIQLVSFAAKDAASREKLLSLWRPGFEYVLQEEVGSVTNTYELYLPKSPSSGSAGSLPVQSEFSTEALAFESYVSEAEFQRVHTAAQPIKHFLAALDPAQDLLGRAVGLNILRSSGLGFHSRGEQREAEIRTKAKKPFTLVVRFQLKDQQAVDKFNELFAPMAKYVLESEPNTLTYEAFYSLSHAHEVIIFERYVDESDLTVTHHQSEAFKQLGKGINEAGIIQEAEKRFYSEMQWGRWGQR
jgi:quinol monooxygenase YgiN